MTMDDEATKMPDWGHDEREDDPSILVLQPFHPIGADALADESSLKRRFQRLFLDGGDILQGGVGKIRKARNAFGETFACKTLEMSPGSCTPAAGMSEGDAAAYMEKSLFREEYRVLCMLSELKGFPKVYGYGTSGGVPVILMEWIEGNTLFRVRGRLPRDGRRDISTRAIASIGASVADILIKTQCLDAPLIHRDLSPNNIMVETSDRSFEDQCAECSFDIRLIDFGSSVATDQADPAFTMATNIWRGGTPAYAAPEMLTNDIAGLEGARASSSIDVYALCSILFELYTGNLPYDVGVNSAKSPYRTKMEDAPSAISPHVESDGRFVELILRGISPIQEFRPTLEECLEVFRLYSRPESHVQDIQPTSVRQVVQPETPVLRQNMLDAPQTQPRKGRPWWILVVLSILVVAAIAVFVAISTTPSVPEQPTARTTTYAIKDI